MLEQIILATCAYYMIEEGELRTGTCDDQVSRKHQCWFLIRQHAPISYQRVADRFGIASHAAVKRAVEKIEVHREIYAQTRHDLENIMSLVSTL